MVIGIIVAMQSEYDLVSNFLKDTKLDNKEIILVKSGIGKVNAAYTASKLINDHKVDYIINTGVAGGIDKCLQVADLVVAENTCYHDFYAGDVSDHLTELGFPDMIQANKELLAKLRELAIDKENVKFGLACTGDQFITNNDELMKIKAKRAAALSVDMESNSIAHVCFLNNIPFISFRIISDTPWVEDHADQYANFWSEAPIKTVELLTSLILKL